MEELDMIHVPKSDPVSYWELLQDDEYSAKHIHMHDTHEINLITTCSCCKIQCNGSVYTVLAPAIIIQKRGTYHGILSAGKPFQSRVIHFDPEAFSDMGERYFQPKTLFSTDCSILSLSQDEADSFLPYFHLVKSESGEERLFSILSILSKMKDLAAKSSGTIFGNTKKSYIFEVIRMIQDHPENQMTIEILSRQFHVSATKLKEDFHNITGYPVKRFVIRQRLRRACFLLEKGRVPLAEIALACGFSGESHLIRSFREEFGVTPGAFRKEKHENN